MLASSALLWGALHASKRLVLRMLRNIIKAPFRWVFFVILLLGVPSILLNCLTKSISVQPCLQAPPSPPVGWVFFCGFFFKQRDRTLVNLGVGIRGHPLWQDCFIEVLVSCSSLPLTSVVFLAILLLCFFLHLFVYFYASVKSNITKT